VLVSEVRGFDTSFERHDDPHADGGPRGRYAPRGVHQRGAKRQGCEDMRETMRGGATSRRSEAGVEQGVCSNIRTLRWVLRGGVRTGLEVLEQQVLEQEWRC
jgi:hypothetical protein